MLFFFAGASNAGWTEYVRRFLFFIMYEIWLTAFPPVLLRLKHAQTSLVSLSLIESPCSFLLTALLLSMICQNLPVVSCGFMWQNMWFRCSVAPRSPRSPSDIRNAASPALMLASLSSNPWVSTRFERHADAPPLCIRRMILRELTQGHARVMNIVFWFSSDFKSQCTWIILNNYNNYVLMVHLWKYVGHLTVFDSGLNIESIFMYLKWFKHDIFFNTLVSSDGTWRCEILLARPALAGAHTQAAAVWPWRTKNASCQNESNGFKYESR